MTDDAPSAGMKLNTKSVFLYLMGIPTYRAEPNIRFDIAKKFGLVDDSVNRYQLYERAGKKAKEARVPVNVRGVLKIRFFVQELSEILSSGQDVTYEDLSARFDTAQKALYYIQILYRCEGDVQKALGYLGRVEEEEAMPKPRSDQRRPPRGRL